MKRGDTIPIDLVVEILSRLPAKSTVRCRCVSKLWCSTLLSPYFTELFLTRSSSRPPKLLFAVEQSTDWCFFTSPHPQNPDEKLRSLAADFHMKFSSRRQLDLLGQAFGFLLFLIYSHEDVDALLVICNPTTGQYASLPLPSSYKFGFWTSFLGFDPIDKQFKILNFTNNAYEDEPRQIFIVGTGSDSSWRKIHCPFKHLPSLICGQGICINGVLYYEAVLLTDDDQHDSIIVCFDVRYEKFSFIYTGFLITKLINHNGKLGVVTLSSNSRRSIDFWMWVVKDVDEPRHKWSESEYINFRLEDEVVDYGKYSFVGVTATSEIVLATTGASKPFYVVYINWERKTIQSVEIEGLPQANRFDKHGGPEFSRVQVFIDHVEDLKFLTLNGAISLSPPEVKAHLQQEDDRRRCESVNKFDSLSFLDGDDKFT